MNAKLRNGLIVAGAIVAALVGGWQIANGDFILVGLAAGSLLLWLATQVGRVPADALVTGIVLTGYLIGNRGFAQLNVPSLPLLPGELALGLGVVVAGLESARVKLLPVRRDALNAFLLAWLALGSIRFGLDVRTHGFVALRDFAVYYYAAFFFLAQRWAADPMTRRWLERCLTVGFAVGAPVFLIFNRWPEFFITHLSVRSVPLIFVKSDVQSSLLIAGTFWFLYRHIISHRFGWLLLASTNLIGVSFANSRAALVAFGSTILWLILCREWRLFRRVIALVGVGSGFLLAAPLITQTSWKDSLAYRFYESATSITDFRGARAYTTDDLSDKPDNNLFRLTWWRAVVEETWAEGRWFGLGFGYDLAREFIRIYYGDNMEDFSARSPHNYLLTVFGRTGIVGLGLLLVALAVVAHKTWQVGRLGAENAVPDERFTLLLGAWGILVSSCFGVVLEGPMGAAVFWTLLGLANGSPAATAPETATSAGFDPHLLKSANERELHPAS